jgi:capsular exopolysaccharide synthesis family protein
MDTTDRSDSKLPAPFPVASSPSLLPRPAYNGDLAIAPAPQIDSRVLVRGLARYWWRILLLWLVISVPVAYLIYATVGPTYVAISRIRIEPAQPNLYDASRQTSGSNMRDSETYLQTQVNLMTTDQVLSRAVANDSVAGLPMIKNSEDANMNLREKIVVEIEPGTYIIRVALESKDRNEAAAIVNAVVDSYLDENLRYTQTRDATLKLSLTEQLTSLKEQIERKKTELQELHQKGTVRLQKPKLNPSASKDEDEVVQPTVTSVDEQQVKTMITAMVQNDIDLLTARADLKARLEIQKGQQEGESQAQQDDNDLEDRVKEAFYSDPEVIALEKEINELKDQQDRHKAVIRKNSDPAYMAAQKQLDKLNMQYKDLWNDKSEQLRKRVRVVIDGRPAVATIGELQHKVRMLQEKKDSYAKMYEKQELEQKATNTDSFRFTYATQELAGLLSREDQVKRTLAQVEFQSRQENYRVVLVDRAQVPKIPSNNKRIKYMLAAPVGVLFMMLGLFLLLEIKAERVADPDALSTRVRSEVYALPPLPKSRELRKRNKPMLDAQIEQFIQRLDHLRFAVCGNSVQPGKGRCVLITSAIGGEGKTTLAAQLAARCGNAGMSTLLIDADLRRGALCPLLDVPEGLGLSDVLKGQAAIEDVVVPVQGGAFNLLCAGTPIRDTSALLQDRQFGVCITQLRQLYDLIIIDSPPVLPVPDALILGRWADGAVLAARYDISRFPQVERARHQLDGAGIAVLGTVINGLRHSDSYYGRYTYSRRRSPETDSSSTI